MGPNSLRRSRTSLGIASRSARSKGTKRSEPGLRTSDSAISAASGSVLLRAMAITRYPAPLRHRTMASPSPRLPPVTTTLFTGASAAFHSA